MAGLCFDQPADDAVVPDAYTRLFLRNVGGSSHCSCISHIFRLHIRQQRILITTSYHNSDTDIPDPDGGHGALYIVVPSDKGRLRIPPYIFASHTPQTSISYTMAAVPSNSTYSLTPSTHESTTPPHLHEPPLHDLPLSSPDIPLADARITRTASKPAPSARVTAPAGELTPPKMRKRRRTSNAGSISTGAAPADPGRKGGVPLNVFMYFKMHVARTLNLLFGTTCPEGLEVVESGQDKKRKQKSKQEREPKKPCWTDMRWLAKLTKSIWWMLSPQTRALWKSRLAHARQRCEDELGHRIEGHGKEYLVEGLQPEDVIHTDILVRALRKLEPELAAASEGGAPQKKRKTEPEDAAAEMRKPGADEDDGKATSTCRTKAGKPSPATGPSSSWSDCPQSDMSTPPSSISDSSLADEYFGIEAFRPLLAFPTAHGAGCNDVNLCGDFFFDDVYAPNDVLISQNLSALEDVNAFPIYAPPVAHAVETGSSYGWPTSGLPFAIPQSGSAATGVCRADNVIFNYAAYGWPVFGNPGFTFAFDFSFGGLPSYPGRFEHGSQPFVASGAYNYLPLSSSWHTVDELFHVLSPNLADPSSFTSYRAYTSNDDHPHPHAHFGPQGMPSYVQDIAGGLGIGNVAPHDDMLALYSQTQEAALLQ